MIINTAMALAVEVALLATIATAQAVAQTTRPHCCGEAQSDS
jgi:hypothetical protein